MIACDRCPEKRPAAVRLRMGAASLPSDVLSARLVLEREWPNATYADDIDAILCESCADEIRGAANAVLARAPWGVRT